jgi:methionyl-tRNA synthetase
VQNSVRIPNPLDKLSPLKEKIKDVGTIIENKVKDKYQSTEREIIEKALNATKDFTGVDIKYDENLESTKPKAEDIKKESFLPLISQGDIILNNNSGSKSWK